MDARDARGEGKCIVSFDGGGPGSVSQLLIIKELLRRVAHDLGVEQDSLRPADYWDLMGGVGFGGFIALLLGRLRMSVDDAIQELATIGTAIFPQRSREGATGAQNLARLKEEVETLLRRHGFDVDVKLNDPSLQDPGCKVVVFATTTAIVGSCRTLRAYSCRRGSIECTFVEAVCATLVIPKFFDPVPIGVRPTREMFNGTPLGFNNPMRQVLEEARQVFGNEKQFSLILSLGSGRRGVLSLDSKAPNPGRLNDVLTGIAFDCERVERELSRELGGVTAYRRLNVDQGMETIRMSDWHEPAIASITTHTNDYMENARNDTDIDHASQSLRERVEVIAPSQPNTFRLPLLPPTRPPSAQRQLQNLGRRNNSTQDAMIPPWSTINAMNDTDSVNLPLELSPELRQMAANRGNSNAAASSALQAFLVRRGRPQRGSVSPTSNLSPDWASTTAVWGDELDEAFEAVNINITPGRLNSQDLNPPCLMRLMEKRQPRNLSGQVVILDHSKPLIGEDSLVYLGNLGDRQVAIKMLRATRIIGSAMRPKSGDEEHAEERNERLLAREINVWAALKHRNVCELLGFADDHHGYRVMVSPWYKRGSAANLLNTCNLTLDDRKRLTREVCEGLHYLHQLKIIHGDMRPTNVLVDDDGVAKLCGFVKLHDWEETHGTSPTSPVACTTRYKAPELFIANENRWPEATLEADIYSLGCMMVEFIEGVRPFNRFDKRRDILEAIWKHETPVLRTETELALGDVSEQFWMLLEACWDIDESRRPDVGTVVGYLDWF